MDRPVERYVSECVSLEHKAFQNLQSSNMSSCVWWKRRRRGRDVLASPRGPDARWVFIQSRVSSDVGHLYFSDLFVCALRSGSSNSSRRNSTLRLPLLTLGTDGKPLFCMTISAVDDENVGTRLLLSPALVLDARLGSSVWQQRCAANLAD